VPTAVLKKRGFLPLSKCSPQYKRCAFNEVQCKKSPHSQNGKPMAPQVTVIFSRHESEGNCSSDVLCEIITRVKPDIMFEELSEANFERAYFKNTLSTFEVWAIRTYLLTHSVTHIPVDTFDLPDNYDENLDFLYNQVIHRAGLHSSDFKNFHEQMTSIVDRHGFPLLNHDSNELLFEKRAELIEHALNALNDPKLYELARLEKEVIEKREETILDTIYRYSLENDYERGLMLIGSGHRKSIMQKVAERSKTEKLKISWQYFLDLKVSH